MSRDTEVLLVQVGEELEMLLSCQHDSQRIPSLYFQRSLHGYGFPSSETRAKYKPAVSLAGAGEDR